MNYKKLYKNIATMISCCIDFKECFNVNSLMTVTKFMRGWYFSNLVSTVWLKKTLIEGIKVQLVNKQTFLKKKISLENWEFVCLLQRGNCDQKSQQSYLIKADDTQISN